MTVTSDVVRIGDLVDNAGAVADIADLSLTRSRLHRRRSAAARDRGARRPTRLATLDTGSLTEVMVTRASRTITGKEIEARIARALAGQYGFGDARNISITFDEDMRTIHVEPTAAERIAGRHASIIDPRTGRFDAAFELPGSASHARMPLRFTGTAMETVEAAVLTRPLNRGEVIKPSDRDHRAPSEGGNHRRCSSAPSPRSALPPNGRCAPAPCCAPPISIKAEIVQRNETVTIVYEVPGILLTVRGKALEAGADGDVVNVLNTQSNRTVQATVTGPGRVTDRRGNAAQAVRDRTRGGALQPRRTTSAE